MADKETSIVLKNEDESNRPPNPFSLLFTKFTQVFNFPPRPQPPEKKEIAKVETEKKEIVRDGEVVGVAKSATVTYPDGRSKTVTSLKLESEDAVQETSPAVLWQVCNLSSFFSEPYMPDFAILVLNILGVIFYRFSLIEYFSHYRITNSKLLNSLSLSSFSL